MTQQTNVTVASKRSTSVGKRMIIGGMIGLLLISFFLLSAGKPNPEWGKLWMIRPLVIVPLAGAAGGFCNYYILHYRRFMSINKGVAILISMIVFMVGLWLGVVLGLDGTMWN